MEEQVKKLNKKIDEIEGLKNYSSWGPEYQLWLDITKKVVRQIFDQSGTDLFDHQRTALLDRASYIRELDSRKKVLLGLLENKQDYQSVLQMKEKKVGILNTGKNNTFHGNTFIGFDVGIDDKGENTVAKKNLFFAPITKSTSKMELFFIIASFVVMIISVPWWPSWYHYFVPLKTMEANSESFHIPSSSINISDILEKYDSMNTSLERQNFKSDYNNTYITGKGTYADIGKSTNEYDVSILVSGHYITCYTNDLKQPYLWKKGDEIFFSGQLMDSKILSFWQIDDCVLSK